MVVKPSQKGTSTTYDKGIDEWLRDNHILYDGNLIALTVELDSKDLADPGPCNVRCARNIEPTAGKRWKSIWKPRGFSQWDVGALQYIAIN